MKKIPSLYKRDFTLPKNPMTDTPNPECDWVFKGEGRATKKYDGTAVMIKDGELFCRREVKAGKSTPEEFIAAGKADPVTGDQVGWVKVTPANEDQYIWQLIAYSKTLGALKQTTPSPEGTFEVCGPHFNKNPEGFSRDALVRHGIVFFEITPPTGFSELKEWFKGKDIEGIVWHHPDGRMAKIKKQDFGLKRTE